MRVKKYGKRMIENLVRQDGLHRTRWVTVKYIWIKLLIKLLSNARYYTKQHIRTRRTFYNYLFNCACSVTQYSELSNQRSRHVITVELQSEYTTTLPFLFEKSWKNLKFHSSSPTEVCNFIDLKSPNLKLNGLLISHKILTKYW